MNRGVVFLGLVIAVAAGWATDEFFPRRLPDPGRVSIRRARRAAAAPAVPAAEQAGAAAPAADPTVPSAPSPGVKKPESPPPKPAAKAPEPPAERYITDVTLPTASKGSPLPAGKIREVHVDAENAMKWFGEAGSTTDYRDLKHLGADLSGKSDAAFVIVPDTLTPWRQIRDMISVGQASGVAAIYVGVAKSDEPNFLRVLEVPQPAAADEPMPEGAVFHLVLESKEGTPSLTLDGKKLETFPADLALAWGDWRKANPDQADTSTPETTHVVLEAPKSATTGHVLQVIDVLRGLGIRSERLEGATAFRKGR